MKHEKIRSLCLTAVFTALICIAAPFSVPVGSLVPISLATFAVYLAAGILDTKNSVAAVAVYILLGAFGLPVFSSFSGGLQKLVGVTGGYIIGYIPLAVIISLFLSFKRSKWMYPLSMILGTVILYTVGTVWFVYQTKTDIGAALMSCVVPFIPGDLLKITAASIISIAVRARTEKFLKKQDKHS